MRWYRFESNGSQWVGVGAEGGDEIHPVLHPAYGVGQPTWAEAGGPLVALLRRPNVVPEIIDEARSAPAVPVSDVRILSPVCSMRKNVFCVGRNYPAHKEEVERYRGSRLKLEAPIFFTKPPSALVGPDDAIEVDPSISTEIDYEGEIALIIGKRCKNVQPVDAWDHVCGFTLMNDVTARDLQRRHVQYFRGKGLDTFMPIGPSIFSPRITSAGLDLELRTLVNGELRQRGRLSDMQFSVPELISSLSCGMTLEPGDIIATGTPDGVGAAGRPPRFLLAGDRVEISCDEIGTLRNSVRAVSGDGFAAPNDDWSSRD